MARRLIPGTRPKGGFKRAKIEAIMAVELAMNRASDNLVRPRAGMKSIPHNSRPNLFGGD